MPNYTKETIRFLSADGKTQVAGYYYTPETPKAIIQISHGMCEYVERYEPMIDVLCASMYRKSLVSRVFTWWISFDWKSLEEFPDYDGPVVIDFYGRLHPKHTNGTVRLVSATNSYKTVSAAMAEMFDKKVDRRLLIRRIGVNADKTEADNGMYQLDLFTDYEALEKEKAIRL